MYNSFYWFETIITSTVFLLSPLETIQLKVHPGNFQLIFICTNVLYETLLTCINFNYICYLSFQRVPRSGENCWYEGNNLSCEFCCCWNICWYFFVFNRILAVIWKYGLQYNVGINHLKDSLFHYVFIFIVIVIFNFSIENAIPTYYSILTYFKYIG